MIYKNIVSKTVQSIPPSGIRRFFDKMKPDTISLSIGEPDFPTPEYIREAAIKSFSYNSGRVKYTSNSGSYELRELIIKYMEVRFGIHNDYKPEDLLITVGASEAIDLAVRAVVNPGDEVIIPSPTYVSYGPGVALSHGVPVYVNTDASNGFRMRADEIIKVITPRTKAVILPYPNNPTGGIMEREDLQAIADVIKDTGIIVIADEIYAELTYGGKRHCSFAAIEGMKDHTIILNGFSKAFSMTGWRVGFAAGPHDIIAAMTKIHQFTMLCAPTISQHAAEAAIRVGLETGFASVVEMREEYNSRGRFLVESFNKMGLSCHEPQGTFYAFPSIKSTGLTSEDFCQRLLKEQNVAVVPGTAFGECGEGHVRSCYAASMEDLKKAVGRIDIFLKSL